MKEIIVSRVCPGNPSLPGLQYIYISLSLSIFIFPFNESFRRSLAWPRKKGQPFSRAPYRSQNGCGHLRKPLQLLLLLYSYTPILLYSYTPTILLYKSRNRILRRQHARLRMGFPLADEPSVHLHPRLPPFRGLAPAFCCPFGSRTRLSSILLQRQGLVGLGLGPGLLRKRVPSLVAFELSLAALADFHDFSFAAVPLGKLCRALG